jgi:hypothetical protein
MYNAYDYNVINELSSNTLSSHNNSIKVLTTAID